MAYDEDLAERIREIVTTRHVVTEQKMFGGLAFMIGGNMAVAAGGQGGLLARVDPAESDRSSRRMLAVGLDVAPGAVSLAPGRLPLL